MTDQTPALEMYGIYELGNRELIAYPDLVEGAGGLMADEGGYVLYTHAEWDAEAPADLAVQPDGRVTFQGEPTGYTRHDLRFTGRFK